MKDAFTTHVVAIVVAIANVFALQLLLMVLLAHNLVSLSAGGRSSTVPCNVTMERFTNHVEIHVSHLVVI